MLSSHVNMVCYMKTTEENSKIFKEVLGNEGFSVSTDEAKQNLIESITINHGNFLVFISLVQWFLEVECTWSPGKRPGQCWPGPFPGALPQVPVPTIPYVVSAELNRHFLHRRAPITS